MFQNFDPPRPGEGDPARLAALRDLMAREGLQGVLVPRADRFQGENVEPRDARLAWLTGFTGSAGLCAALADRAALFVDGRYTLQAAQQSPCPPFEIVPIHQTRPEAWLADALPEGARLGLDPWLHGRAEIERLEKALAPRGTTLVHLDANPVDALWADRPEPARVTPYPHPLQHVGENAESRRLRIGGAIAEAGADAALLSAPDSVAWLLNIRGGAVARSPAPRAMTLLEADGAAILFLDPALADAALRAHLGAAVTLRHPDDLTEALTAQADRQILLDRAGAPIAAARALEAGGGGVVWGRDPVALPKAQKTEAERAGMRAAQRRDGAAVARFLRWIESHWRGATEIDAAKRLETFRADDPTLTDLSFDSIIGAGPNGAIVHYRVTEATDRALREGELLLVDSGGQYRDGTTDITRVVALGAPGETERRVFTLVLKGMIAVSRARFPEGTTGRDLDTLARAPLWAEGYDYDHGTGHGVGAALEVHEGPQSLSRRGAEPLRPGMIVSNEPGCYLEGRFGVRIENLLAITPPQTGEGGRAMMGFETLTFAPIARALIEPALLEPGERAWLDAYHAETLAQIGPLLDAETRAWLETACAPL